MPVKINPSRNIIFVQLGDMGDRRKAFPSAEEQVSDFTAKIKHLGESVPPRQDKS
jgi:hypothetical protein